MTDNHKPTLLPSDALTGLRVAISASESADLARLGLMEDHFKLALGEIGRSVLVSGGKLVYGGHLSPDGYTVYLLQELHRYSRLDRPFRVCLAWPQHRAMSLQDLEKQKSELGLFGDIVCLGPDGTEVDYAAGRRDMPEPVSDEEIRQRSLTAMRSYMAKLADARVMLGGKRSGFQGRLPGLLEEALITLRHKRPLYLAAGFGGITWDIAKALNVDDGTWFPTISSGEDADPSLSTGLDEIKQVATDPHWAGLNNGLTQEENTRLAATHRPSDIAALVALGLGRLFFKPK